MRPSGRCLTSALRSLSHFLKLLNSFADAEKKVGIQAERENTYIKDV